MKTLKTSEGTTVEVQRIGKEVGIVESYDADDNRSLGIWFDKDMVYKLIQELLSSANLQIKMTIVPKK